MKEYAKEYGCSDGAESKKDRISFRESRKTGAGLSKPMFTVIPILFPVGVVAGALVLFLLFSKTIDGSAVTQTAGGTANPVSLVMLVVPAVIIALCLMRKHLITALSWGILAGIAAGLLSGVYTVDALISFPGGFSYRGQL